MSDNSLSKSVPIIAVVLLFIAVLVILSLLKQQNLPIIQPTPTTTPTIIATPEPTITPTPTSSVDISDWDTYRNTEIGIEFKYPSILGIPEILQTDNTDKKPENIFRGKKTDVRFKDTNNSWLLFVAYTSDYQSFKDFFIFRGSNDISNECLKPFTYNNKGEACKTIEIANDKAIWKNYFNEDECSPIFGSQVYFNNNSQSIYKGLSFMFHIKNVEKKVTDLYSCVDSKATEQAYLEAVVQ
jgi:hypothetical protein